MKKVLLVSLSLIFCNSVFAGGTIGGGGAGTSKEQLMDSAFHIEKLPSIYVADDVLRRTSARLSVDGVESVDMPLDKASIQVRRLQSSIVDVAITRKVLSNPQ